VQLPVTIRVIRHRIVPSTYYPLASPFCRQTSVGHRSRHYGMPACSRSFGVVAFTYSDPGNCQLTDVPFAAYPVTRVPYVVLLIRCGSTIMIIENLNFLTGRIYLRPCTGAVQEGRMSKCDLLSHCGAHIRRYLSLSVIV
jgi:hypothetical protein